MAMDRRGAGEEFAGIRIDALDNEDLGIEELLDIEDKIDARIEELEERSEALSGALYGEKQSLSERKRNLEEKERVAEALESLETQREALRERVIALQGVGEREES